MEITPIVKCPFHEKCNGIIYYSPSHVVYNNKEKEVTLISYRCSKAGFIFNTEETSKHNEKIQYVELLNLINENL